MKAFTPLSFRSHCYSKYGTFKAAAMAFGVTTAMVSHVASGKRNPTRAMLESMGIYSGVAA